MEAGHEASLASCDGLYDRCIVKEAFGVQPGLERQQAEHVCRTCRGERQSPDSSAYGVPSVDLRDHITPQVEEQAQAVLDTVRHDPSLAEIDGVKLGKLALADLLLGMKLLPDEPLDEPSRLRLSETLHSALTTYLAVKRILQDGGFTDLAVFNLYASNAAAYMAARRLGLGAKVLSMPSLLGVDGRFSWITTASGYQAAAQLLEDWPKWRSCPLTPDEVKAVGDDMLFRPTGRNIHIYSPARKSTGELLGKLDLDPARPLLVAFTSSPDECFAAQAREEGLEGPPVEFPANRPFEDQAEWLRFLYRYAAARDDLQLVVRIHPREDSNKRDGRRSAHFSRLAATADELPANARLIMPQDDVSSYDLLEMSDLVLISWSTIGIEAARMGLPVLAAFQGFAPCPTGDFIQEAPTLEEYRTLLDRMAGTSPGLDSVIHAFRWYYYSRMAGAIPYCDVLPDADLQKLPPFRRPIATDLLELALFGTKPIERIRLAERLSWKSEAMADVEGELIRTELRRYLHYLFTGRDAPDYRLTITTGTTAAAPAGAATLSVDGLECRFTTSDGSFGRLSRAARRIGFLAAQEIDI